MTHKLQKHTAKKITRIETFSDGVFAIAITLLVLVLIESLHGISGEGILALFSHNWQSFVAFTIGFITILVCWLNHHVALEYMVNIDTKFVWVNGLLLFLITLAPFPTAVLGKYFQADTAMAFAMFSLNYVLISIAADAICSYAYNHHLIEEGHREFYYHYKKIYRYAIVYNLIVFGLCFVSIIFPIIMNTFMFMAFAAPEEFATRLHRIQQRKSSAN